MSNNKAINSKDMVNLEGKNGIRTKGFYNKEKTDRSDHIINTEQKYYTVSIYSSCWIKSKPNIKLIFIWICKNCQKCQSVHLQQKNSKLITCLSCESTFFLPENTILKFATEDEKVNKKTDEIVKSYDLRRTGPTKKISQEPEGQNFFTCFIYF